MLRGCNVGGVFVVNFSIFLNLNVLPFCCYSISDLVHNVESIFGI